MKPVNNTSSMTWPGENKLVVPELQLRPQQYVISPLSQLPRVWQSARAPIQIREPDRKVN